MTTALHAVFFLFVGSADARAQVRGVYPLGISVINPGVTPEAGFSYSNLFAFYSRNELKGPAGELLVTGNNSVMMDLNGFVWASRKEFLGGARLSLSATLPIANNSLTSDIEGAISGGGGLADSYYQPLILGWQKDRAAVRAVYGFLAPTGRFVVGAKDNVGSGYWTHVAASGQTFYLDEDKSTSVSAFQMYEFHTVQEGTGIHPGQTFDLDYSVTHTVSLPNNSSLQVGLVGYGQWQTTDKRGPMITEQQAKAHYRVSALGFTSNMILPARKVSLGLRYFNEFKSRSTFEGYSVQISASITF